MKRKIVGVEKLGHYAHLALGHASRSVQVELPVATSICDTCSDLLKGGYVGTQILSKALSSPPLQFCNSNTSLNFHFLTGRGYWSDFRHFYEKFTLIFCTNFFKGDFF